MNVVILCAGFATRMYPLTKDSPKPLLEVAGKPVLDYLMEQLLALPQVASIHIVSNAKFFDHFTRWHQVRENRGMFRGVSVQIHDDGSSDNKSRRGAAGDLLLGLLKIGKPGRVLVSGGDNIYQFPIKPLWQSFSHKHDHCITALVETELEKLQKTGVLEIGEDDCVLRLHEKPEEPPSTWTSPPLYFFQPSVWSVLKRYLKTTGNHDAPGYFIDYLCQQETVQAFRVDSTRFDIGCLQSYQRADRQLRQAPLDFKE